MIKILIIVFSLISNAVFASDEKTGRYFEDQPDVTDKPQVHFIYLLNKELNSFLYLSICTSIVIFTNISPILFF